MASSYLFAIKGGAVPTTVAPGDPFFWDQTPVNNGFTYDPLTGTFTALNAGVYDFSIRIDTDDGGTGVVPRQYYLVIEGVPRPSDSFMDCQIPTGGVEYPCSVSFIMQFSSPNQAFTLVNESGIPVYYGFHDGNPFANEMEMTVFRLN